MSSRIAAFGRRWLVAYLVLYMFPFPLGRIPGVDALVVEAARPWHALLAWVGDALFEVEAVPRYSGSGDTMYHHIELLCVTLLATLAAVVWSAAARTADVPGRVLDRARTYARVYLGGYLLIYGWSKLIPTQFPVPGPDRLIVPYGDSSPMGLLWTFMGASTGYQMMAGLAEVVAGVLLFWRRSALLGALLGGLVMSNVVALNYCYDVPVKLFASHLLLLAIFILAPDLRRLVDVLWFNRPVAPRVLDPYPIERRGRRRLIIVGKLLLIALLSAGSVIEAIVALRGTGGVTAAEQLHGIYDVESFGRGETADPAVPDAQRWLRVGIHGLGRGAILRGDGSGERFRLTFLDAERGLRWTRPSAERGAFLRYALLDDGRVKLWGSFDGEATTVVLRRRVDGPSPLQSHHFRWIHERPNNR